MRAVARKSHFEDLLLPSSLSTYTPRATARIARQDDGWSALMALSPTALSKRHLEADGWLVAVVERWNPHARIRQDLFGFIDLVAVRAGETLAVQATSTSNVSTRVTKIAESPNVGIVREAGWAIHVHGWSKKQGRWVLREVDVS